MFTNPIKFVHRGIRNWSRRQKRVVVTCQHRLKNLAVFVSGSGSNFRKIYKSCREGYINGSCVLVVTNNPDCLAAEFAQSQNIPVSIYPNEEMSSDLATKALVDTLKTEYGVDFILLAGYLRLIPSELLKAYPDSILNIHPALLPSFGGKGYYGRKVHEAVLKSGAKFSGATVHFVNEEYDKGSILDQRVIPVLPNDTAETLAARVLVQEHELYPYCVRALCNGQIKWNKNRIPFIEQLSQSTM